MLEKEEVKVDGKGVILVVGDSIYKKEFID